MYLTDEWESPQEHERNSIFFKCKQYMIHFPGGPEQ